MLESRSPTSNHQPTVDRIVIVTGMPPKDAVIHSQPERLVWKIIQEFVQHSI
jgi:hypothetical protein